MFVTVNKIMSNKPTPLTDAFIQSLRERLHGLKIKQKDLAKDLGTTPQHLCSWFKRTKSPNSEKTLWLVRFLNQK